MRHPGPALGWTILITGASSGLGRCLALELGRRRCSLVLTGRDASRLAAVAEEVRSAGSPRVEWTTVDLSLPGGAEALVADLAKASWTVDGLVNNAGAGRVGPWRDSSVEADRAFIRLLVDAPLTLTRAYMEGWRRRGRGAVLNIASTGAFQPGPHTAIYYAAKAFLVSWSLALAREERGWLKVTTVCPGALKTGFSASAGKRDVPGAPGPESAARIAVRAWCRGRGLVVPGVVNRLLVFLSRLLPSAWSAAMVEAIQTSVRKR